MRGSLYYYRRLSSGSVATAPRHTALLQSPVTNDACCFKDAPPAQNTPTTDVSIIVRTLIHYDFILVGGLPRYLPATNIM